MSDYIKKDDIIKWVDDSVAQCGNRYSADMLNMMDLFKTVVDNCLPFANVVPAELYQRALNDVVTLSVERKRGEWMGEFDGWDDNYWCSECKSPALYKEGGCHDQELSNFCPNCGADLRGES